MSSGPSRPDRRVASPPGGASPSRERLAEDGDETADVEAARRGDEAAFARLVRRRQGLVTALLAMRVRRRDDVDDLAQEVFLRAWKRLGELREPGRFTGWLARIAVNAAHDFHRRAAVRPRPSSLDAEGAHEPEDGGPPGDRRIVVEEEFARALEAIGDLDPRSQAAVALRFLEGLPVKEIAERLGDSPAATAMRLTRALRALRKRLE